MNFKAFQDLLDKKKAIRMAAERRQRRPAETPKAAITEKQAEATPETVGENVPSDPIDVPAPEVPETVPAEEHPPVDSGSPEESPAEEHPADDERMEAAPQEAVESDAPQAAAEQKPKSKKKKQYKKKKAAPEVNENAAD